MQYNLTVSGFFSQPNIPARVSSLFLFFFSSRYFLCYFYFLLRTRGAFVTAPAVIFMVCLCMCVCVSPANVTVMLTGVAHEAIHLLQPQLLQWLLLPKAQAAAAKLLHQHFVCIRAAAGAAHECVCVSRVCACAFACLCVCVCVPGVLHHHLCKYLFSALFV